MGWGMGTLGSAMATEPPFSFLTPLPPEKLLGWGMRPIALRVLPLASGSRARLVPSKILFWGCGPSRHAASAWCPARLWAEGGPSSALVNCRSCPRCTAGLRPEAWVTARPGPLGGQPGVGALLCNLKLEKVIKKEILTQRRGLKTRKMRAWQRERDCFGNSNQPVSKKANVPVSQMNQNSTHLWCLWAKWDQS